jgi:hypothetical protein
MTKIDDNITIAINDIIMPYKPATFAFKIGNQSPSNCCKKCGTTNDIMIVEIIEINGEQKKMHKCTFVIHVCNMCILKYIMIF